MGVFSLTKCPECLNATHMKSPLSRDEDDREEEEEDVIDAMLNSGRDHFNAFGGVFPELRKVSKVHLRTP